MKRLTKRPSESEEAYLSCERCGKVGISECWTQENCTQTAVDRLADIEDILGDDYDMDRLRELVEADREGRCVVLPFRPPKTVYSCSKRFPAPEKAHYASAINILWDMDRGCVFGDTPEDAEAALKGDQDG